MAQDRSVGIDARLRPSRLDIAKLVTIGAIQALAVIGTVLLLRQLVDQLNTGVSPSAMLPLVYFFGAVGVVLAFARGAEYTFSERVGYRLVAGLRMYLFAHLLNLPARGVQRSSQGAVLLRFTGDLSTYRTWISRGLSRGIIASFTLAGSLAVLIIIDWIIALAVVGVLMLGAAGSALWGYRVRRTARAVRWRRSLLTSNVAEQIRSIGVVQAFGRTAGETNRLGAQNDDLLQALYRAASARGVLRFLSSLAGSFAIVTVLVVGVLEAARQLVTIGDVVAAIAAARFLTGPVRILGRSHEYWQAAQVSKRKLKDFLARTERSGIEDDLPPLRPRRGRIEFRGVSVPGALDDVNLVVEPGELVAIIGDNGAGKSSLLSVVARFVDPAEGQVLIDGQVLTECSLASTARNVGMVSPDLPLMRGTLRRNIGYRYAKATDELIEQVVLSCRIDEVLESIDGGMSAWVVEGGTNLPMGHRQRVMLARATLGNPRLLLLDEPTTNLDPATKEIFRRVIARYRGTVLLVTHDPVEASLADHVVVMESGRIERYLSGDQYRAEAAAERRIEAGRPKW